MGFKDFIRKAIGDVESTSDSSESSAVIDMSLAQDRDMGIFKAYIPNFLYKPPYGYPRNVNTPQLKVLAKNPYIFSVIKTICDEIVSCPWEVKVKEGFQDDGNDYNEDIDTATRFLNNPNGNAESFEQILRQVVTDILETDSGIINKVFNSAGELQHIFARDGSLFLKNPDIYGYLGNRADFVEPMVDSMDAPVSFDSPSDMQMEVIKTYNVMFKEQAAYFQYGWTAGSMPVPFGKKEIIYFMQNPRSDSIYGRSPLQVLAQVIQTLVYGSEFNLDFYVNNNMPDGVISLMGAKKEQIAAFRDRFDASYQAGEDEFGKKRKKNFTIPIVSTKPEFVPFQLSPKDMEVLAQQEWFMKIVWACFGVTASEMGWTESSNKATDDSQTQASKRKAIQPLLKVLQYNLNTQLMPSFFKDIEFDDFRNVPLEIVFDHYDVEEDKTKHDLLEQEIRMGVKTPEMAAEELGINVEELKQGKEEQAKNDMAKFEQEAGFSQGGNDESSKGDNPFAKKDDKGSPDKKEKNPFGSKDKKTEEKSKNSLNPLKQMEKTIDEVGKQLVEAIDRIPEDEYKE